MTRFAVERKAAGASNGEINRELAILKRGFSLALKAGTLTMKPHIPKLREDNVRTGFFDRADLDAVLKHLPARLHAVVTFGFLTGWRIPSEVLKLQWRHIDLDVGTVRLDPSMTKNGEGREFPRSGLAAVAVARGERRVRPGFAEPAGHVAD